MLRSRMVRIAAGLLLVLLALATGAREARADDAREAARAHFARGLALAAKGGYQEALDEFNRAYEISPQFAVLYNIAQCQVALGHPLAAIDALSLYLRDGGDRIPALRLQQVQLQ